MKIALVVPHCPNLKFNDVCAPMNLGHLASYLRSKNSNVEIKIIDGGIHSDISQQIFLFQPNIVGVTATTPQAPSAYLFLDMLRINRPDILTVIGGVHASAMPFEALKHADVVVVGEGEKEFVEIVRRHTEGKIQKNVIYDGEYIENLDEIPSPAYDLIDLQEYIRKAPHLPALKNPTLSLVTSRGCKYRCVFCRNSSRNEPVRYFSAKRVVDEIEFFITKYGIKSIMFNDDEMAINVERLKEMKKLLIERNLIGKFVWGCQARATSLNRETIQLMKSMGCRVIALGIEHVDPELLRIMKCGSVKVEDTERALQLGLEEGVYMAGGFVFGYPSETKKELKLALNWIQKHIELSFVGINVLIPFPATTVYKLCMQEHFLPTKIDYERMLPTMIPSKTYIVNKSIDPKYFNKFMLTLSRFVWIYDLTRPYGSVKRFLKLAQYKTWWWCLLFHPIMMYRAFKTCIVWGKGKNVLHND